MRETGGKQRPQAPGRAASGLDLPRSPSPHRTHWAIFAVLAGLVAVLLGTGIFFVRALGLEETERLAENNAIARGVAAFIEARHQAHLNVLLAYAGRFRFREVVKRKNRAEALIHLRQLAESFPELDRPFLTDPAGVLWAIYPEAPQSLGRSFADRDWYKGVSREWRPYVSEVYAQYRDQALAVALAVPIRDLDGTIIGILVSPQRLEVIRQWLLPITIPNGDLYIVDRKGQLVFHRTRTGPDRLLDYAQIPVVQRLLRGEEGIAETENPVEGEVNLTAYRLLRPLGWGLVVHREKNLVLQQMRTLILISAGAGFLFTVALAILATIALRNQRQTVAALAALEEKTLALQEAQEELVRKERLASEAKQEAERANQAKSEFLSRMSHELRTPLNAVLGFAQLLEMERLSPEQRESVDHILKGGRHLLGLIDEVLDISRIEAGRLAISPEPVLVSDVLREILDLIRPLAAQWDIRLDAARTHAWDRHVLADRQRLKQVLLNLLSNAAKFNRHGGSVTVSVDDSLGDRLRIMVTDTGPGIPPEKMARLFTPFDRLGAEQTGVEGTGLGLVLSKRLVELMGGTIGVESAVEKGSAFWVELPRVESPVEQLAATREGVDGQAGAPTTLGTVLYIEDNLPNLRLVERLLARRPNVKLLSAMQGRMGLELAREHRPGLILLDLQLPDMPGAEVLQRLQSDPRTSQIPVVVISADAIPGQIKRLLASGAREFLTKPLDVKKLIRVLDESLNEAGG